ncbi:helix-turn-helix domain-containing protein [Marinobacter changyiensis]|uniref:helix-turn-helix domain-containing protein n=1 Tax=Marinobacter changyiensis TaxID=2604091 RepID=UPI0012649D1A|nr:helix-turn-helix transcriptional regulator [Marinobacter changyiensis]
MTAFAAIGPEAAPATMHPEPVRDQSEYAIVGAPPAHYATMDDRLIPVWEGFTGNLATRARIVPFESDAARHNRFVHDIQTLREKFGLSKLQTSKLLLVSRQTIYDWEAKTPRQIRPEHEQRLAVLTRALGHFDGDSTHHLGKLLKQKADPTIQALWNTLTDATPSEDELNTVVKTVSRKMKMAEKARRLSENTQVSSQHHEIDPLIHG